MSQDDTQLRFGDASVESAQIEIIDEERQEFMQAESRRQPFFMLFQWVIPVLLNLTAQSGRGKPAKAKAAVYVYLKLAQHADRRSKRVRLKWETIAEAVGISKGHVNRSIATLEAAGLLARWGQERGRCASYEMVEWPPADGARPARPLTDDRGARPARFQGARPARARHDVSLYALPEPSLQHQQQEGGAGVRARTINPPKAAADTTPPDSETSAVLAELRRREVWPEVIDELQPMIDSGKIDLVVVRAASLHANTRPAQHVNGAFVTLLRNPERIEKRHAARARREVTAAQPTAPSAPQPPPLQPDREFEQAFARKAKEALRSAKCAGSVH